MEGILCRLLDKPTLPCQAKLGLDVEDLHAGYPACKQPNGEEESFSLPRFPLHPGPVNPYPCSQVLSLKSACTEAEQVLHIVIQTVMHVSCICVICHMQECGSD